MTLFDSIVVMIECEVGNTNQWLFYIATSLQIVLRRSGKCVDYDFSLKTIFFHTCHGGRNQKWYHSTKTNSLKSLHDTSCMTLIDGKLLMKDCNEQDSQKFLIPSSWSGVSLNRVRSMSDHTLCMVYDPDQNNNVYMDNCISDGGLSAEFYYDFSTREIKNAGLCMHLLGLDMNVIMMPCDGSEVQRWFYDFSDNQIYSHTNVFSTVCLDMASNGNLLATSCSSSSRNQDFLYLKLGYLIWKQKILWTSRRQSQIHTTHIITNLSHLPFGQVAYAMLIC